MIKISLKKRFFSDLLISFLIKCLGFLFLVLFSFFLSKENKGILAEFNIILKVVTIATILILLGLQVSIPKRINKMILSQSLDIKQEKYSFIKKVFSRWVPTASIFFIIFYFYSNLVLFDSLVSLLTITLILLVFLANAVAKTFGSIVLSLEKVWLYQLNDHSISYFFLLIYCSTSAYIKQEVNLQYCIAFFFMGKIISILLLNNGVKLKSKSLSKLKSPKVFSDTKSDFYLTSSNILNEIQKNIDIIILSFFSDAETVALYSIISLAPFAIQVTTQVLNSIYTNTIIIDFQNKKTLRYFYTVHLKVYIVAGIIALIYSILAYIILDIWIGRVFTEQLKIQGLMSVAVLLLAQIFNLITGFSGLALNLCSYENLHFRVVSSSTILCILISIVFVSYYGIFGLSLSLLLYSLTNNGLKFYLMRKHLTS